ncbi:MAG: hypothetical protein J6128_06115 [Clostridia bacterium]|nr:hypothetical protein [Clostridia bacterium]
MLSILLKKQLQETFRSYYFNPKTNKSRSTAGTIVLFVLFGVVMVVFVGGMMASLAATLCLSFHAVKVEWLFFLIMSLIALTLGVLGSVFNTYSRLYLPKDNDLLLSMPIPVSTVIISRLLSVYLMGLLYSSVVLIPSFIVYWIICGISVMSVLGCMILMVIITVLVLSLSCLLGWVVAKISVRLKNRSIIVVLISLAFIVLYYVFYFNASTIIRDLMLNALEYGEGLKNAVPFLYRFGMIGTGDLLATLIFLAASAVLFVLVWFLLRSSFLKLAITPAVTVKKKYRGSSDIIERSIQRTLLTKEFRRFVSSPAYMLNCGLGSLLLVVAGVFLLIFGGQFSSIISVQFGERSGFDAVLLCAGICLISSMNDMATPSVSLEGKSIWILKSSPVTPWQVLSAKLLLQITMTGIPALFASVCAAAAIKGDMFTRFMIIPVCLGYVVLMALFDLLIGLVIHNLNWVSEIVPIKQSIGVLIALFGGWVIPIVMGIAFFVLMAFIGGGIYLLAVFAVMLLLSLPIYLWMRKRGPVIYSEL